MNTGTPMAENCSASFCSVTVLPVPVAPVIRPWRFASAGSNASSAVAFLAIKRGSGTRRLHEDVKIAKPQFTTQFTKQFTKHTVF